MTSCGIADLLHRRRGPLLMGVLNVTPDSFSDGGAHADVDAAVRAGLALVEDGADLLDVGGESTRPGAAAVPVAIELARVVPVLRALRQRTAVPLAIDTTKAEVAHAALDAGATIVNDISGGRWDALMLPLCDERGATFIAGHLRGHDLASVHTAASPSFDEVVTELAERVAAVTVALRGRMFVDPGLGFGKGTAENLELLQRLGELRARLGLPVLVGPSRKRFLGELTGRALHERDDATVGACLAAAAAGADMLRVHDVRRVRDALVVFEQARPRPGALAVDTRGRA